MTNPDNIVRVRARNGGRASVLEANGWCQMLSTGLLDGKGVVQNTVADLNVLVGGTPAKPDVVIAQTPSGYKVALDIVGQQPIQLTKPGSGKRYVAIVAYTDDLSLSTEETNVTGSPSTCGLIAVNGKGSQLPTDSEIRSAITTDGATGSQAAYGILATVEVDYQATAITDSLITIKKAGVTPSNVDFATMEFSTEETKVGIWTNGKMLYRRIYYGRISDSSTSRNISSGLPSNAKPVFLKASASSNTNPRIADTYYNNDGDLFRVFIGSNISNITINNGEWFVKPPFDYTIFLYYTKD